jgi:hypothetical protein
MKELRIYFESFEQGANFIYPVIKRILSELKIECQIKLIKLKGNHEFYCKRLSSIIYWKNPDILISVVNDKEEYPIIVMEFSNAVFTADHELQRFDGLIAAAENKCIYIKISPLKKESPSAHGGDVEFDYVKPYALIYKKFKKIFFHFDWEVGNNGIVKVDENYLSCPNNIDRFERLLKIVFDMVVKHGIDKWILKLDETISNDSCFKEWSKILKEYEFDSGESLRSSRTRLLENSVLELKLNRFGHAMDPERGMLAFYGTLFENVISKMMFDDSNNAWYKDIPNEDKISKYIEKNGLRRGYDFLYCFMLGSGLDTNEEFKEIVNKFENDSSPTLKIDVNSFIENNFSQLNKALRTIFKYSKELRIIDKNDILKVIFVWKIKNFIFESSTNQLITSISELSDLDEDLVTYITIHNILKENNFKILSVSYPGAQGDRAILVEAGTGRRQERKYLDIIAYLPKVDITTLQENKGKFTRQGIQIDIDKLSKYKTNKPYFNALRRFQQKYEPSSVKSTIKIGIGFWANKNFTINKIKDLKLNELDYFIYITSDMKQWKIWRTGKENIFIKNEGKINFSLEIYEIIKNDEESKISIKKFL